MDASPKYSLRVLLPVLLLQQTIGALSFPISKYGLAAIEPFAFAFYRFVISSLVLLVIVRFADRRIPIERGDYKKIVGLGLIIIPFNQALYLVGQSLTAAGHGAVLYATTPIWILLGAMFHLRERPVPRRVFGIIVALAGVAMIMSAGAIKISTAYLLGDVLILGAVLAWAYYAILGKPLLEKYGALRVTAYAAIAGCIIYLPLGLWAAAHMDYSAATAGAWASVAYMAVATSVLAYTLWGWVLKYMQVSRMAVFHNIQPVVASAVAYFWLGENLGWSFVVGGVIVLAGVLVAEL